MRRLAKLLAVASVGLVLAGCGEPFLLFEATLPEFSAPADKAMCVVIRPSQSAMKGLGAALGGGGIMGGGFDANALAKVYVEGKLVAGLQENSVASFEVEPGDHIVMSQVNTLSKVRYNFQAGKVYYIQQVLMPIPMIGTGQAMKPMTPDEYKSKLADNSGALRLAKLNPAVPAEDMDADDVAEEKEDWDKWAKKNPEEAKAETEYPGY
jgi:hypothetical protein